MLAEPGKLPSQPRPASMLAACRAHATHPSVAHLLCNLQVVSLPHLELHRFSCKREEGSPGLACAAHFTRLELSRCHFEGRWLATLSELRHLKLDSCLHAEDGEASFKSAFTAVGTLQHLTSLQYFGDGEDERVPATTLLRLSNLRSLNIRNGYAVDENGVLTPLPVGRWSNGLEELHVGLACALRSLPALQHTPALCSLTVWCPSGMLSGCKWSDDGFEAVCTCLARHQSQLRHLRLLGWNDGPARSRHVTRCLLRLQRERPDLCVDV